MGNILIFTILAVTIPRWALTLAQVDTFGLTIGGSLIPIAAIGEAIVLEFGNLFILSVFTRCQRHAFQWQADWEKHDELMRDQSKHNRRPEHDPRIRGYSLLPAMLLTLETLTLLAQTPFIAGQLLGIPAVRLLNEWGRFWVWAYAFLLVIAPGVMTIAIGFGINYDKVTREIEGKGRTMAGQRQPVGDQLREWATGLLSRRLRQGVQASNGRPVAATQAYTGRLDTEAEASTPSTGQTVDDSGRTVDEISQSLAAHLSTLQGYLSSERQTGRVNGFFRRADIERACRISKSHASNVIRYGVEHGVLEKIGRYEYEFVNKE